MKDLLFVKNIHLPIFSTQKSDSMSDEEWGFEHERVCDFIRHFVDEHHSISTSAEPNSFLCFT